MSKGPRPVPAFKRMMTKFEPHPTAMHDGQPCWRWTGSKMPLGYGMIHANRKTALAHRLMYQCFRGPIPEGLHLDHLCRNPWCVNPDHLEPVTHKVNILRGESIYAKKARQTHCQNGHEFTAENTFRSAKKGYRDCRICMRVRRRAYYERTGK